MLFRSPNPNPNPNPNPQPQVFALDYQVEAPISAIIHSTASDLYAKMFHLLWRIKRVEWSLAASWKCVLGGVGG